MDAYIERSADFARPILKRLRTLVHRAAPDITETIKWGFPHFERRRIVCSMAAFQRHCAFGFRLAPLMKQAERLLADGAEAMGHLGRITRLADLPSDARLLASIKEAVALDEQGVRPPPREKARTPKRPLRVPADLAAALKRDRRAKAAFDGFSPSHRREYVEWITEAKTEATRSRRLDTALQWLAEGKHRNWKYERKR